MFDAILFRAQYTDYLFDWRLQHVISVFLNTLEKRASRLSVSTGEAIPEDRGSRAAEALRPRPLQARGG
jgi:hypothetical protein